MEQLISLGQIDSSDTLGSALHHSALHGNKKALKKALEKGNQNMWCFVSLSICLTI